MLICPVCLRTKDQRVEGVDVDPLPEGAARWVECPECSTTLLYAADTGTIDLGIVRPPGDPARNQYAVLTEAFTGIILNGDPRAAIHIPDPPALGELLAEVSAALRCVIDVDPMHEYGCGGEGCIWCDAPMPPYPEWNKQRKPVQHEADCAWALAHRAVHERLPAGHEMKDPA